MINRSEVTTDLIQRFRLYVVLGLIAGLVAFGLTFAFEVFHPASFLAENNDSHSHSGDVTFGGSVVKIHAHPCIHSTTILDVFADQTIESGVYLVNIRHQCWIEPQISTFDLYHLRAPPLHRFI